MSICCRGHSHCRGRLGAARGPQDTVREQTRGRDRRRALYQEEHVVPGGGAGPPRGRRGDRARQEPASVCIQVAAPASGTRAHAFASATATVTAASSARRDSGALSRAAAFFCLHVAAVLVAPECCLDCRLCTSIAPSRPVPSPHPWSPLTSLPTRIHLLTASKQTNDPPTYPRIVRPIYNFNAVRPSVPPHLATLVPQNSHRPLACSFLHSWPRPASPRRVGCARTYIHSIDRFFSGLHLFDCVRVISLILLV